MAITQLGQGNARSIPRSRGRNGRYKTTQRVLERIPEDKLAWKPHAKSFSLGQLGLHIARAQGALADAVSKDTFEIGSMTQAQPEQRPRKQTP